MFYSHYLTCQESGQYNRYPVRLNAFEIIFDIIVKVGPSGIGIAPGYCDNVLCHCVLLKRIAKEIPL